MEWTIVHSAKIGRFVSERRIGPCLPKVRWCVYGKIVAKGTPEDIANSDKSYTGKYLKKMLGKK
jgi:hypothetical protein